MKKYFAIERKRGLTWQEGTPMASQKQWAEHAAFMNGLAASGRIILGGPIGTDGDILLIADVRTEEDARAMLDADPWTETGLLPVSRVREWVIQLDANEL